MMLLSRRDVFTIERRDMLSNRTHPFPKRVLRYSEHFVGFDVHLLQI